MVLDMKNVYNYKLKDTVSERKHMKKDNRKLQDYREKYIQSICEQVEVDKNKGKEIYKYLEDELIIKMEAPDVYETSVERLFEKKYMTRNELGLVSVKPGNIYFNLQFDVAKTIQALCTIIGTGYGITEKMPVVLLAGLINGVIVTGQTLQVQITENGTAIIMALQSEILFQNFMLSETICYERANEILRNHNYPEMNEIKFQDELTKLEYINCIRIDNDNIYLKESICNHF